MPVEPSEGLSDLTKTIVWVAPRHSTLDNIPIICLSSAHPHPARGACQVPAGRRGMRSGACGRGPEPRSREAGGCRTAARRPTSGPVGHHDPSVPCTGDEPWSSKALKPSTAIGCGSARLLRTETPCVGMRIASTHKPFRGCDRIPRPSEGRPFRHRCFGQARMKRAGASPPHRRRPPTRSEDP